MIKPKTNHKEEKKLNNDLLSQYQKDKISNSEFDRFYEVMITLGSEEFNIPLKEIMVLKDEGGNFDFASGMKALEQVTSIRQIIITGLSEIKYQLNQKEDEFEVFLSSESGKIEEKIIELRKKQIEEKVRKDIGQITKDQKMSTLLTNSRTKNEYLSIKEEINKLKSLYIKMEETLDNLKDRSIHLCTLLRIENGDYNGN